MSSRSRSSRRIAVALVALALIPTIPGCGSGMRGGLEVDVRDDPRASGAMRSLIGPFEKKYPAVVVTLSSGTPLESRLRGGTPPDAFLTAAGRSLLIDPIFDGRLRDLTSLALEENWPADLPEAVRKCVSDGRGWWMAPVGVHRSAILRFVPENLKRWSVTVPRTWDEFVGAALRLREQGVDPLVIGADSGTIDLFEAVAVGSLGPDNWDALWEGRLAPDGPEMTNAWRLAKTVLDASFGPNPGTPAGDPLAELKAGRAAFTLHHAAPPFGAAASAGGDFESAIAPGTAGLFVFFVDGFVLPRAAKNPTAAREWLRLCSSRAAEDDFNRARGVISVRLDSDLSGFDDGLRAKALDYRQSRLVGSLAYGDVASDAFTRDLAALLAAFLENRDAARAGRDFAALIRAHGIAK